MNFIENQKWRYATKRFDPQKKVSDEALGFIKEAIQLSASSYGLQLYKVLIIQDPKLREKLKIASWGQQQVTDASYLFVFCHYRELQDAHIDQYIALKASMQNIELAKLSGYASFIKGKLAEKSPAEQQSWMARQTYLALGNLLAACAELKIDASPMEGFDPERYSELLGLEEQGLSACVIAGIGYRATDDASKFNVKVRKPIKELFETVGASRKTVLEVAEI